MHSSAAQSRLSSVEAGGGSARLYNAFTSLSKFLNFPLVCPTLKAHICTSIFKPSVLTAHMAHVSRRIECVLQIRFWKGTKLGVEFHTCYDHTCNPHNNSCYAVLLRCSLSLLPLIC